MGCESIIQVFFHMMLNLKLYHWDTTKYARHVASDNLHGNLSTLIDQFIEVYIGRYKRPAFKTSFNIQVYPYKDDDIESVLHDYINFLKNELPKYLKKDGTDTDLLNIRDEILSELNKTLYLFTLQ